VFEGSVEVAGGTFELLRSAARTLTVNTVLAYDNGDVIASLDATDCLFDNLNVGGGLARLECCTVMGISDCKHLQASDCVFAGSIENVAKPVTNKEPPSFLNCIRYSSIPVALVGDVAGKARTDPERMMVEMLGLINERDEITLGTNTVDTPVFIQFDYCDSGVHEHRTAVFGEPGYGVLDPVTSGAVRFGAEDGGEMGAYHYKYYSLRAQSVLDKMREFLPVGIEPVLIHDARLLRVPPAQTT